MHNNHSYFCWPLSLMMHPGDITGTFHLTAADIETVSGFKNTQISACFVTSRRFLWWKADLPNNCCISRYKNTHNLENLTAWVHIVMTIILHLRQIAPLYICLRWDLQVLIVVTKLHCASTKAQKGLQEAKSSQQKPRKDNLPWKTVLIQPMIHTSA